MGKTQDLWQNTGNKPGEEKRERESRSPKLVRLAFFFPQSDLPFFFLRESQQAALVTLGSKRKALVTTNPLLCWP